MIFGMSGNPTICTEDCLFTLERLRSRALAELVGYVSLGG